MINLQERFNNSWDRRCVETDLAAQLGFERPREIRRLIQRHEDLLTNRGILRHRNANSGQRGRPAKCFYLNEAQALMICLFCRTEKADEVRNQVVDVFMAWRKGALTPVQQPKLPGDYVEALEALIASEKAKRVLEHRVQNLTADACRGFHKGQYFPRGYTSQLGQTATKLAKERGIELGAEERTLIIS